VKTASDEPVIIQKRVVLELSLLCVDGGGI
jgi:hypothetical protein